MPKSAAISEQTKLLAAAEFAELYPTFFKTASKLSPKKQNALYKIACILGQAIRSEIAEEAGVVPGTMCKKADVGSAIFESLLDIPDDGESLTTPRKPRKKRLVSKKKKEK